MTGNARLLCVPLNLFKISYSFFGFFDRQKAGTAVVMFLHCW
jgi:hypothetical protein